MIRLYSSQQMRQADEYTISSGTPSSVLMERAGKAIAEEAKRRAQERGIRDILVVCGGGNNGGDGFVAARYLAADFNVDVLCLASRFSPDCQEQKEKWTGKVLSALPEKKYPFILDCLFGTGLSRAAEGENKELIEYINASGAFVLSADMPSGLNGTNGLTMGVAVKADVTVTIGEYKSGLVLGDGIDCAGKIVRADIGIDSSFLADADAFPVLMERGEGLTFPRRRRNAHKGSYGRACIIAGSKKYSGAALLSTLACLRGGAGYPRLCVPEGLFFAYAGKVPEAVLTAFSGGDEFAYCEEDLRGVLDSDAIALGMGCGNSRMLYAMERFLLKNYEGTLLLDADGLNALSSYGTDALKEKKCRVIVTPHIKEFSRLSGKSVEEVQKDPAGSAAAFAREYGVGVLLKSAVSLYSENGKTFVFCEGSPCLAKGGSGDVLSGLAVSFAAQGALFAYPALAAARVAGLAAELAEAEMGVYSVCGRDVIERLPRVISSLTEKADDERGE